MIIRLQHQRSDGEKDVYHLKSGRRYNIGRGSACEVRILDLKLSRKHCAVEYSEGEWRLIDLASTNGCKVDGDQIVGSVPLRVGATIDIGQSSLQIVRILGDDEADEEALGSTVATLMPAKAPAASAPAAPAPAMAPAASTPAAPSRPGQLPRPHAAMKTPAPLEQEGMDGEPAPALEHVESEWEPEPEPESLTKTGALVPNAQEAAAAAAKRDASDESLAAARAAANAAAEQMSDNTGQIKRPGSRLSDKPPTSELESGGYRSLDQIELADESAVARKLPGAAAPANPAPPPPPPPPPTPSQLAAATAAGARRGAGAAAAAPADWGHQAARDRDPQASEPEDGPGDRAGPRRGRRTAPPRAPPPPRPTWCRWPRRRRCRRPRPSRRRARRSRHPRRLPPAPRPRRRARGRGRRGGRTHLLHHRARTPRRPADARRRARPQGARAQGHAHLQGSRALQLRLAKPLAAATQDRTMPRAA